VSKFFFKGRQDARQNHIQYNYQTKGKHKIGSKKYPLVLVVTSEVRKQEVAALVAEAELYADISVDTSEGAVEAIAELTTVLNRESAVIREKTPTPNEPCSCGSGKKYKKCCARVTTVS